jgi:hypothetical protein
MARDKFIGFPEERYDIKLMKDSVAAENATSRSFMYRKITTFPKTSEEQSDQLDNNSDKWYG